MASGQLVRHIGELPRQSRVVAPEPPFTRTGFDHVAEIGCRGSYPEPASVARPGLCAGTVIPRNAPCAPPLRAVYPNLAIGALGCTRLRGWCRDRRLEFRFGRRATRGWRVWIDQGNSCNRQLERRNRLRNPCRQGGLAILDQRSGDIRLQAGVGSARGLQQGIQTKSQTCPNGTIDNKMDADGCGHAIGVVCRVGGDQGRSPPA